MGNYHAGLWGGNGVARPLPYPVIQMKLLNKDKYEIIVASDVATRDGIGVEIYEDGQLIIDIFRDDTKKTKEVTLFKEQISVEIVEEALQIFKKEIPQEFQDWQI